MPLNNTNNRRGVNVSKNGSTITTMASTINFNSNDYNVTDQGNYSVNIAPRSRSVSNTSRTLNTTFIVSSTRDSMCTYTFSFTNSTTIAGGTSGTINAQTSPDGTTFATQASGGNGLNGGLIVGIAITCTNIIPVTIFVPAGHTVRLQTTGTGVSFISSQETLL